MATLQAGWAVRRCSPRLPVDLVGFLRRACPATEILEPLEVGVLVADAGGERVAIASLDLAYVTGEYARALRSSVARGCDCSADNVLVHCQHTHSAPATPGAPKLGGSRATLLDGETEFAEALLRAAASAAERAAMSLSSVRLTGGLSSVAGVSGNRRESLSDGGMAIGFNSGGPCDRTVHALRFVAHDGRTLTLVSFACHPTVLGPEMLAVSPDYVGPLRRAVRRWSGGECMFLQGCAGDIAPVCNAWATAGEEQRVGRLIALEALRAVAHAEAEGTRMVRTEYLSGTRMALYRPTLPSTSEGVIAATETQINLPLRRLPSEPEIKEFRCALQSRIHAMQQRGRPRTEWNAFVIQARWAEHLEAEIRDGRAATALSARIHVLRINDVAIVGLPGEPFNVIGHRIRELSPAKLTMTCGYCHEALGYIPTSEDYGRGGYEIEESHRNYGYGAPIAAGADEVIVSTSTEALRDLFERDSTQPY